MSMLRASTGAAVVLVALGVVSAIALGLFPAAARACDTPVYRYAMYNWPTAPYYVFYFHHGQVDQKDAALHEQIEKAAMERTAPLNVRVEPIDVTAEEKLEQMPQIVVDAWKEQDDGKSPVHLVYTAWGAKLFAGRLDEATFKAIADSPARRKLGELLKGGNASVLLLLTGPDQAANKQARQAADAVIAEAVAGKFAVDYGAPDYYMPEPPAETAPGDAQGEDVQPEDDGAEGGPDTGAPPADGDAAQAAGADGVAAKKDDPNQLKLAVLEVSRTDPAEKWLVESLLSVESDLLEYPNDPMVFAVYGRGRAMPPYVGKGITADNLADVVSFLLGPCSCMVKDQNPGMDLMMAWDWDGVAEVWAASDPAYSNDPWSYGYQEYGPPEQAGVQPEQAADASTAEPGSGEVSGSGADRVSASEAPADGQDPVVAEAGSGKDAGEAAPAPSGEGPAVAATAVSAEAAPDDSQGGSLAARQVWLIGAALLGAAVLVVAVGMVLMRRTG